MNSLIRSFSYGIVPPELFKAYAKEVLLAHENYRADIGIHERHTYLIVQHLHDWTVTQYWLGLDQNHDYTIESIVIGSGTLEQCQSIAVNQERTVNV